MAGSKLVKATDSALCQFLNKTYNDALAVEEEGFGFLKATYSSRSVSSLVIRGISDLLDDKGETDAQGYKEIASHHASAFAFQVLEKLSEKKKNLKLLN